MGCFSCSGCLFSSLLSFSYPLLSLASAGLAVAFSFCLSTVITLTCATISYNHYSCLTDVGLHPLYATPRPQTLQMTRLALGPSCANSEICGALTPSPKERNLETSCSSLMMQLPQPKATSNYNHTLHSRQENAHIQINAGDKRRRKLVPKARQWILQVATPGTVQDWPITAHLCHSLPVMGWQGHFYSRICKVTLSKGGVSSQRFPFGPFWGNAIFTIHLPWRAAGKTLKCYYFMISY